MDEDLKLFVNRSTIKVPIGIENKINLRIWILLLDETTKNQTNNKDRKIKVCKWNIGIVE